MRISYFLVLLTLIGVAHGEPTTFSGSFNTSINTDFLPASSLDKELSSSNALGVVAKIPNLFNVSSKLSFDQDLRGERKGEINDTYISVSRKIKDFNENLKVSGSTTIYIPISKSSREVSFLNTGYKLSGTVQTGLPRFPNLSTIMGLSFVQNFHRSAVSASGSSNKQFLISASSEMTYTFLKNFDASASFSYTKGRTYKKVIIDTYSSGQQISYNASEKLNIGLGHSIGGNIFKINGKKYNFSIFDVNKSKVYLEMNLGF
jgi:hypothetical protein